MAKKTSKPKKAPAKKPKSKRGFVKLPQKETQKAKTPGCLVQPYTNPNKRDKKLADFIDMEAELLAGKTLLSVRRPVGRPCRLRDLPDEVYTRMLQYIILGCFDHVAAAALGITVVTFYTWKAKGETSRKGVFRRFYLDVCQAQGIARQIAEQHVKTKDALAWLRSGPGRSKEDVPGWTDTPSVVQEGATINFQQNNIGDSSPERKLGVAGALLELQRCGHLQITEQGLGLLGSSQPDEITEADIIDEESDGNTNGNGNTNGKAH